jgi:hypothetical protein
MDCAAIYVSTDETHARRPRAGNPHPNASIRTTAVYVLFTSIDETSSAIRIARDLAQAMKASLMLVGLRASRYPRQPAPAEGGAADDTMKPFVECLRSEGVTIGARFYVCRDERQAIPFAFPPHSLIVVGGRHGWLPTRPERLRRALEASGHFVLFVNRTGHHD